MLKLLLFLWFIPLLGIEQQPSSKSNEAVNNVIDFLISNSCSSEEINKTINIIDEYRFSVRKIYSGEKIYTSKEIAKIKQSAYQQRTTQLVSLLGESIAKELNEYYDFQRQLKIMRSVWKEIPVNKLETIVHAFIKYDRAKSEAILNGYSLETIKKYQSLAKKEYQETIQNCLNDDEYEYFLDKQDKRADEILKRNYRMTDSQLAKYKTVMNSRSVKRVQVKKKNLSAEEKSAKLYEVDLYIRTELQNFLSSEQVDVWWRNMQKID